MLAAMVLAAGLGTRLRPLTEMCAKALLPVGDRPALAHVLDSLRAAGLERIVVNAHHRADDVLTFARANATTVTVSVENDLLGTAGGVSHAATLLGEGDVLLWNADVVAAVHLPALVARHATADAQATLVVQPLSPGKGPVGIDGRGRIVRLRNERVGDELRGGEFLGVSIIGAPLRARLPSRGCLVGDVLLPALRKGATLRAFDHEGPWSDIGTPARYLAANMAWLDARGLPHWTGDRAEVDSRVSFDRVVVGEGATASGVGLLARCVVWPGARVTAPLVDAIVAPGRVVCVPPR